MNGLRQRIPLWQRLPRVVYWIVGGAIALFGAFMANGIAAQLPLQHKFWAWILGSVFIFGGLMVLCMGTKSRLSNADEDSTKAP